MKIIRKLIYRVFGLKSYLKIVSIIYIRLVRQNFFKSKYPELFYLKNIVNEGDTCVDIGANLGYYSTFLSKIVGSEGRIFAVEPVPLFQTILHRNLKKTNSSNVELLPYALGEKEEKIKMGMPEREGVIHHGMTKVADSSSESYVEYFEAEMKIPNYLFADIPKINFIKCDVEGYETHVFSNMIDILKKHSPVVQSELGGKENRISVFKIFEKLNYDCFQLKNYKLVQVFEKDLFMSDTDFYFKPKKS
jgi:FkbM family methyltransferase